MNRYFSFWIFGAWSITSLIFLRRTSVYPKPESAMKDSQVETQCDAENRPIRWQSGDTVITMSFDRMGRRVEMRTVKDGVETLQRFVYDNYLCVQQLRTPSNTLFHSYVWDPTEPIATRPLVFIPSEGETTYYFHDGNKNVSDLVDVQGDIVHYAYTPFGSPTATSANNATENESAQETPFRFSSEYHDSLLGVTSYNYRCYLASLGVWISRDPSGEDISKKLYEFVLNRPVDRHDSLGLELTLVYESAVGNPEVVASYSVLPKITSPLKWTKFHFHSSDFKSTASTAIPFPNGALQIERGYCECKCLPVDYSYSITPGKCVKYRQLMRQEYKDYFCPINTITSYTYKDLGWTYTPPQFNRHTDISKLYVTTVKPVVSFEGDGTIKGVNCRLPCMQKCASLSDADSAPVNSQYRCGD